MSPALRSKSKVKKAGKETFHTSETAPVPSLHAISPFQTADDSDDHSGNSSGTGVEYDTVSNNGSWSGESEDHKEKSSQPHSHQESVPGADNDKREKIRQKNEKKHQRQKERRAQELHDRCSGYLMSRKLEALAQKLVAMGFSHERATMALILNEGRVEESVAWLFEGGEECKRVEHKSDDVGNLKLDVSGEFARIADMEIRYKASKQDVERVVVSCEGDLDRAEQILKTQRQDTPAIPHKPQENGDPPIVPSGKTQMPINQNAMKVHIRATSLDTKEIQDDRDFNYTNAPATVVRPSADPRTKHTLASKNIPPKSEWAKSQQIPGPAEKRWPNSGSNPSDSCASALPGPYLAVGNALKNLQLGSVRESVVVMQRPQSINAKQAHNSSVSSSPPRTWYPSNVDMVKPRGVVPPPIAISRSISRSDTSLNPLYDQIHHQSQQQQQFVPNNNSNRGNGLWNRGGASPMLSAASSLGLFSGLGANVSSGSSSPVDWNTGSSMLQFDYTSIDWSLDLGALPSRPNGLWAGSNYGLQNNARAYDSFAYGLGVKSVMRPAVLCNGNSALIPGLREGVASDPSPGGSREWTSPFEEKDIFSLPTQFVSSPSL